MYAVSRSVTIRAWGHEDQLTSSDRVKVSGIAGSTTGALTGLFRMPHTNYLLHDQCSNIFQVVLQRFFRQSYCGVYWEPAANSWSTVLLLLNHGLKKGVTIGSLH